MSNPLIKNLIKREKNAIRWDDPLERTRDKKREGEVKRGWNLEDLILLQAKMKEKNTKFSFDSQQKEPFEIYAHEYISVWCPYHVRFGWYIFFTRCVVFLVASFDLMVFVFVIWTQLVINFLYSVYFFPIVTHLFYSIANNWALHIWQVFIVFYWTITYSLVFCLWLYFVFLFCRKQNVENKKKRTTAKNIDVKYEKNRSKMLYMLACYDYIWTKRKIMQTLFKKKREKIEELKAKTKRYFRNGNENRQIELFIDSDFSMLHFYMHHTVTHPNKNTHRFTKIFAYM